MVLVVLALCVGFLVFATLRTSNPINFPLLFGLATLLYVAPQLIATIRTSTYLGQGVSTFVATMALCYVSIALAYFWRVRSPATVRVLDLRGRKLRRVQVLAYVYGLVGLFFYLQVAGQAEAANLETGGQWTGAITIYFFLSRLMVLGLLISLFLVPRKQMGQMLPLIVAVIGIYVYQILGLGRRGEALELFSIASAYLWYSRGKYPSRAVILTAAISFGVIVASIGDYRASVAYKVGEVEFSSIWKDVVSINYVGNFEKAFSEPGEDVLNAVYIMQEMRSIDDHALFFDLWNRLVHSYVPGQIIGHELKESLMFENPADAILSAREDKVTGSSITGFGSTYISFGLFGCVWFFIIAAIMSDLERRVAVRDCLAALSFAYLLRPAVSAAGFTHYAFFMELVFLGAFLSVPLSFLGVKSSQLPRWGRRSFRASADFRSIHVSDPDAQHDRVQ